MALAACFDRRQELEAHAHKACWDLDPNDAQDAAQEALIEAKRQDLDGNCKECRRRLFAICANKARGIQRKSRRATQPCPEDLPHPDAPIPDQVQVAEISSDDLDQRAHRATKRFEHFSGGWERELPDMVEALDPSRGHLMECLRIVEREADRDLTWGTVEALFGDFLRERFHMTWSAVGWILRPNAEPKTNADRLRGARHRLVRDYYDKDVDAYVGFRNGLMERLFSVEAFRSELAALLEKRGA